MKKKKSGSVAIPFLITFLIALVLVGGTAMYIYDKISSDDSSLLQMTNEAATLGKKDDHTVLFVVDMSDTVSTDEEPETDEYDEEDEEDEWEADTDYSQQSSLDQPYTFMVMRSEPVNKHFTFMGIPCNMLIGKDNKESEDIYIDNGVSALKNGIEYTLGIEIDRYMVLNTEAFSKVCNIMGGVTYPVPKGVRDVEASKDEQYLSAEQIESIISCGGLSGGELQRISTASALAAAMTNQASGKRLADILDNSFSAVCAMADETDISAVDYDNIKYAVKFMLRYSDPENEESGSRSSRASFITPYGSTDGGSFTADRYFAKDIKNVFEEKKEDEQAPSENTRSTKGRAEGGSDE